MDRLDAMAAFVAAIDRGSLAAAARRLGRSPASVTRAIAAIEDRLGARVINRTTRALRLTEAGDRYLALCRRVLADLEEIERGAAGERAAPRGLLTLTAPALFGRLKLRPLVDGFLDANPEVRARLLLLDRVVNLIDEGIDVAVRLAHLPDSSLVALRVGEVRRVVCASPVYLERRPAPATPDALARHACIGFSRAAAGEPWSFAAGPGMSGSRQVAVRPRLAVNGAEAAIDSAVAGHGITRVLAYQVEEPLRRGYLVLLLTGFEPPPVPVHLVYAETRLPAAKLRAFLAFAAEPLRADLARVAEIARAAAVAPP